MVASVMTQLIARQMPIRHHGNGFAQVQLTEDTRMHVWTPKTMEGAGHNATIHDHVFDLHSQVLLGALEHQLYDVHTGFTQHPKNHFLYELLPNPGKEWCELVGFCALVPRDRYCLAAGSAYSFAKHQFHSSKPKTDYAITLMRKTSGKRMREPLIVCPKGEAPWNAFAGADNDPSWMYNEIATALKKLDADDTRLIRTLLL